MKQVVKGFTLIEVIVFIIVTSLMMSVIALGLNNTLKNSPAVHNEWQAVQLAQACMEYALAQKRLVSGYAALACPGSVSTTLCANVTGYTVTTTLACTTWNTDTHYKTITVAVSGKAAATLTAQIGDFG